MNKKKKWYLVDGDWTELNARTQQEAIEEAVSIWNSLSEHDKEKFWVAQYSPTEDGIDFNTEEYLVNILDIVR